MTLKRTAVTTASGTINQVITGLKASAGDPNSAATIKHMGEVAIDASTSVTLLVAKLKEMGSDVYFFKQIP